MNKKPKLPSKEGLERFIARNKRLEEAMKQLMREYLCFGRAHALARLREMMEKAKEKKK